MPVVTEPLAPFHVFAFHVSFQVDPVVPDPATQPGSAVTLCSGSFSECTGLEATMEPAVIREGGRNYGDVQRAGRVTFGTVILRRGITTNRDLWKWWELVNGGAYAYRLAATIELRDTAKTFPPPAASDATSVRRGPDVRPPWRWQLRRCLPVKFKVPDFNAMGAEVGIEELHLAHEGLLLLDREGGR